MAILGLQLVFSLVVFSILQKLSLFYSFGRWLLRGRLIRYLHPTDEELRNLAGIPHSQNKTKNKRNDSGKSSAIKDGTFTIPRNTPVQLEMARITSIDLVQLKFYAEYQWLMDFSVCAVVIYITTEVYYAFLSPQSEFNMSVLWCLLSIAFCLRVLSTQMSVYFRGDEGGERMLCVIFAFFFLVMAMGILIVDDSILEFGLQEGYANFSSKALEFLQQQELQSHGPVTFLTFRIILALLCAVIGALLTFPGLRYAKLHLDALRYSSGNPMMNLLLHINFMLPLLYILLWFKPIGRTIICGGNWHVPIKLMPEPLFETVRIVLIFLIFTLRLGLIIPHIQAHLNMAHDRIEKMKKESGRISNLDLQKSIAQVFYYACVVTLQYITPAILLLFLMFLQKTLGGYSWSVMFGDKVDTYFSTMSVSNGTAVPSTAQDVTDEGLMQTAAHFTWTLASLRQIFSPLWYRGLLAFMSWWVSAAWFIATLFGIYYYSRLDV